MQITFLVVGTLVGIVSAGKFNTRHKMESHIHKNATRTSKKNWIIEPPPQKVNSFLLAATNFGAKVQRPNGYIGTQKASAVARYGQGFPQATQLNSSQKISRPVQLHPGSSPQLASWNESRHGLTPKSISTSKFSPVTRKVPNTSQTVSRPFVSTGARSADNSPSKSIVGRPRDLPIKQVDSPLASADVQGAVVEKGIEVMGKMVDKQLQIIDEAQQKAENFLKKEIKLDIVPDKGWRSEDMFVPPGYHLDSTISGGESSPKEAEITPYAFPAGIGTALMNGCYGTGYQEGDPCYVAKWTLDACLNMIDGAAFMGVGFDGRGQYSPDSRKMSIVQRSCAGKATYDDYDVPDTMNVHGIYDTKASMVTFESRSEFQTYLQEEAGVSGSYFGFYAGVKEAWGQSTSGASQQYMALLSVDVNRYEIFLDEVKPEALSLSFLREFMSLPTSYFAAGAPFKYQDFIQRWGTHYIKSSKFGGQLQIRKTMLASEVSSKEEFAVEMEMEYKSLFASVGSKSSTKSGTYERKQSKTTSTTIMAFGGSHEIATILSDAYSPTFKNEFKDWLVSIPQYPKPFQFKVGPITNLLDFRANDLFPSENINWGCEGNAANLQTETNANGDKVKYYQNPTANGTMEKHYCVSDSRKGLEEAIKRRRISLQRATEIYMEEGSISITDFKLPACSSTALNDQVGGLWQQITSGHEVIRVQFDMKADLIGIDGYKIPNNMSRLVKYEKGRWFTSEEDGSFHLYNAFNNGKSDNPRQQKMSIMGLVLSYNEQRESLELLQSDLQSSKQSFPDIHKSFVGKSLASIVTKSQGNPKSGLKRATLVNPPCNVKWSNTLRFDPTDYDGKCLHFTASTEGRLFVVFSTLPNDKSSWYYIEIGPDRVAIYKGQELKTSTTDINARGLGDASLLQSYFVCVTESNATTLIEYGKSLGSSDSGDIYLNMLDVKRHLNVRFYAFGNSGEEADVIDARIVSRGLIKAECKGDTYLDLETRLCTQKCHEDCDPLHGCNTHTPGNPLPTECNVCRIAKDLATGKCLPFCTEPKHLSKDGYCLESSSTFDFVVKTMNWRGFFKTSDINILGIREIPRLDSITMSFWLRLPGDIPASSTSEGTFNFMMFYLVSGEDFSLGWRYSGSSAETQIRFETGKHPRLFRPGMSMNDLKDHGWHHMCITWSGDSGATIHYLDGSKRASNLGRIWSYAGGGGFYFYATLFSYEISGFNLWNKVLLPEEVEELSRSCVRGIGNAKTWMDFLAPAEKVQAKKGVVIRPSACEAPHQGRETDGMD